MVKPRSRKQIRQKIKLRSRKSLHGSEKRPRVSVFRSLKHISAQAINDELSVTLASASSYEKEFKKSKTANVLTAQAVGKSLAQRLKAKGISTVVFDRNGFLYHGKVKSLAESLREEGIKV